MKKTSVYVIMLALLVMSVTAVNDKVILRIDNCYNVTTTVTLLQGNRTSFTIKDCTQDSQDSKRWNCDCHNIQGTYNLTMQTDDTSLESNEWRYYKFDIQYTEYDLYYDKGTEVVVDYGGGYNVKGEINPAGHNTIIKYETEYVNRIIYVNNTINNTVTEYIDRNNTIIENHTEYIENTTKIEEITQKYEDERAKGTVETIVTIIAVICFIIALIALGKKREKKENGTDKREKM